MAADVHVYKNPNRLKYDSIPLKPSIEQQELMGNGLSLPALLQLSSAGVQGLSDLSDESEADLDELGMSYLLLCIIATALSIWFDYISSL